jgi:hypothetical protein
MFHYMLALIRDKFSLPPKSTKSLFLILFFNMLVKFLAQEKNKIKLFSSGIFSIFQQPSHAGHHIPGANYAPAARVAVKLPHRTAGHAGGGRGGYRDHREAL